MSKRDKVINFIIFNWNVNDGIASDSWSVDAGSAGVFTGCISYGGYPLFFKEDHIYKVYGSYPSNYELLGSATLGLAEGCAGSLAVAGEVLFYLSRSGICAYTGGIPQPMGKAFGAERFNKAVAGSDGLKYYVSMCTNDDDWRLYVYDTQNGVWHKEDELHATHFVRNDGNLYCLDVTGQAYLNDAKRIQEGIALSSVSQNEDFDTFKEYDSKKISIVDNFGAGSVYEYINSDSDRRNEIVMKDINFHKDTGLDASDKWRIYDQMKDEEIGIYNYYYAKHGKDAADKYLNSIRETLNYRSAQQRYGKLEGNTALELLFAAEAGLDQFSSGVKGLVSKEYTPSSETQILSGMVREDLTDAGPKLPDWLGGSTLAQAGYDVISTTSNMVPSILTSIAIGSINKTAGSYAASALLGASSAGSAYQKKINMGYSKEQAGAYGFMIGLSEVILEKLLGGISKLGGGTLTKAATEKLSRLDNVLSRFAESAGGKILMNAGSEALEEGLQFILEPYLWQAVSNEEVGVEWDEALYSALLGAVTGGVFESGETAINKSLSNAKTKQIYGGSQQELVAEALELAPDNAFAKRMKRLVDCGKTLSGSQLNKLVQMNEAAIKQGAPGSDAAQQTQTGESVANDTVDGEYNAARGSIVPPSNGYAALDQVEQNQSNTFQEEVQRQFERSNGYEKTQPKVYDIDKVFSDVQSARSGGAISEERYSEIVDTLAFAQSDYAEGNITEAEYQGMLETAMRQVAQQSGRQMASAVSATDPMVNVDRQTWQQAQRLAKALGRDIVFYNGLRGENGYYKDGTIYVNILADDPFAQVVSHELTHSLEGTRHYDRLKRFVKAQMARSNIDLAQARKVKADQYKSHGKELRGEGEIDAEIVAEYVQTHLLTDEQAIMELVAAERNLAQRIRDWLSNFARRIVGKQATREQARLEHAIRIYGKALQESRSGYAASGTVSLRSHGVEDQTRSGDIRQSREQTEADWREGRISDEEYDAAMDEYDRAEEDRLGHSLEKYSVGNSSSKIPQKWLHQAYLRKPISLSKKDWSKVNNARAEKYRGLEENQIPEMDFFPLAEYNELNIGHMYVIRNYGIDTFSVISKKRLTGRYDGYLMEATNDGRTVQKVDEGTHREGSEQRGQHLGNQMPRNRGSLSGDTERSGEYGNAEQGNSSSDGGLDSGSRIKAGSGEKYSFSGSGIFSDRDSAYMDAVKRGDTAVAQKMVDAAAKAAGYDSPLLYHNLMDNGGNNVNIGTEEQADVYVVFDPNHVKSADPIVYDNNGNVIPLSERFDVKKSDIRYSLSGNLTEEQERRPLKGSYTTDEVEMQARKNGYPVLHGEQIVPFRTWVRTVDRGNYGLVTGMAPENKLLVSFHNKHDGGTADNVPIAYENLVPVPGAYQMTKEEFASLMASEPIDPGSEILSEEDMQGIEELYHQANGGEENTATPIDLEKLPKNAQRYLSRAKRKLLNNICKSLGVPRAAMLEHLQGVVDEITGEYLNSGRVSEENLGELFDKAYSQGLVTDREFYDQYKHIKDHLRTTAVTLSEADRANIADFNDFRKRQFGRLRIVNQGGLPIDTAYEELRSMAPELFSEDITHPADQLVHMAEVARSIEISKRTLDEFAGPERETYRSWAKHDFNEAVGEIVGDLYAVRRFADERAAAAAREKAPATPEEAMEVYKKLEKARRTYERVAAKNLLTQHDKAQVGRLLRHEIEVEHLDPEKDNVKGITAVYEAKVEYERLCKLITDYRRHIHGNLRSQADRYLKTANDWKDKQLGIAYARETMRRNIYDIVPDRSLAREINEVYFEPVHDAEAKAVRLKDEYRKKVREMNLSRKVAKGNLVSEAHAVQLLGEAMDNIRILENTKGRMQHRDGKTLADWRGVVMKLWDENPNLDQAKIRATVEQFRKIYDDLFEQMNKVRVENGYEPINYRSGYFPHFQPGEADSILAQFGRALGIDTQVVALPTTIAGLTHTFKPGIQWFGNAQERLGFNTAYDAVEGFDKYIEGAASVIFQTGNIQRLRAFATQVRYRTSNEGIQEQVDAVNEDNRLTDEEKQVKIANIYEHGKFALANFVAELDEYTNLLANKKSKYDRTIEALMGRKVYAFLKWWESRVGANMIAGNLSSALTNFIPLIQAGAQMDRFAILNGMWKTLASYSTDDGLRGISSFLTNRKGSDPLVQNWSQVVSGKLSIPMETIDQFVSGSIVRGAYYQNLKRGMSESEAMHQADIFAAGVMADRSKGSMPTLMQASNPLFKMFTQFQLEVNNQFSEVFKDLPRNHRQQGIKHLALVLFKYFLGALLFNELYEWLIGRRPALDPIGILINVGKDFADPDVGFGEGVKNLGSNILGELPFSSGLTLLGFETDGGRIPASSAVPDLTTIWDAATDKDMHWKKRLKEIGDEVSKPLTYVIPSFGGNQISKLAKGLTTLAQGGSYTVDNAGNAELQYPVDMDDPWSALGTILRATLLGKSSLPEAQEWVDRDFDGLNAKETTVYLAMKDAGVSAKDAYALLQTLGTAKETEESTKLEIQRNILRESNVSGEGKALAYYGLLATYDDEEPEKLTERVLMDQLADIGADPWEVTKALMDMKDANSQEGADERNAKYDAILRAALTDEEKTILVGSVIGTDLETEHGNLTQYAKFKIAVEGGMGVDEYLRFRKAGGDIDDYLDFSKAGLDTDNAMEISLALDELAPLNGKERVADIQRWRTCVDFSSNEAVQLAALAGAMNDKQYAKVQIAYEYSISPDLYVTLKETLPKYDENGNGTYSNSEITSAINSIKGLTKNQKAVLWQLSVSSKSARNNPYSVTVGQEVLDAMSKD